MSRFGKQEVAGMDNAEEMFHSRGKRKGKRKSKRGGRRKGRRG
jgi:hypothetical protein